MGLALNQGNVCTLQTDIRSTTSISAFNNIACELHITQIKCRTSIDKKYTTQTSSTSTAVSALCMEIGVGNLVGFRGSITACNTDSDHAACSPSSVKNRNSLPIEIRVQVYGNRSCGICHGA